MDNKQSKAMIDLINSQYIDDTAYYFAYSVDLNHSISEKRYPSLKHLYKAKVYSARISFVQGALYLSKISSKKPTFVPGAVYKLSKRHLTRMQKHLIDSGKYRKVRVFAKQEGKDSGEWCFTLIPNVIKKYKLPKNDYFNKIYDGYLDWNINPEGLYRAWEYTAERLKIYKGENKDHEKGHDK